MPVIFHNLRGYDSHLIMQHLDHFHGFITCIPNDMEKYTSFTLRQLCYNLRGEPYADPYSLRFIDSLQFMNSSLSN